VQEGKESKLSFHSRQGEGKEHQRKVYPVIPVDEEQPEFHVKKKRRSHSHGIKFELVNP